MWRGEGLRWDHSIWKSIGESHSFMGGSSAASTMAGVLQRILKNMGLADGSLHFAILAEMGGTGTEKGVIFFPCVASQD